MEVRTIPNKTYTPVPDARTLFLCSVLACFTLLRFPCSAPADAVPPNVILITIDTLRPDHLGCYGNRNVPTPTIDKLARDGVIFGRAFAQVPLTLPSHVAILTGTYPMWNGVEDLSTTGLDPGIPTLAELFHKHGYSTAAFVSAFVLNSMWGLKRGFDAYDDAINPQDEKSPGHPRLERRASATVDRALRWMEGRDRRPFFLWLHLYDPHSPYDAPEPFATRFRTHPYDGEIAYADQELGRVISHLEAHNLYRSSVILLSSDHGEGLGQHGEQVHGLFIYNSTVHVPLILKLSEKSKPPGRSVNQIVNTIDIAPTLVEASGFVRADSGSFQGRSLLQLLRPSPGVAPRMGYSESLYPRTSFGWHSLHGIETEQYHYIDAPVEELYDLKLDPEETRNLAVEKPDVATELRGDLRALEARYQSPSPPSQGAPRPSSQGAPASDLERLRRLRTLGYVGGSTAIPPGADPPGAADPKQRLGFYSRIMRAADLAEDGRFRESNQLLSEAVKGDPKAYLPLFLLGENALIQEQYGDAKNYYRRALEVNPGYELAAIGMGHAALEGGDPAGALNDFQRALDLNPRDFMVKLAMAGACEKLNRLADAASLERDVLTSHPDDGKANSDYGVTLTRLHRYAEGMAALEKAVTSGYRTAITYNFLGTARLATGHPEDALQAYEEAMRLDPKYSAPCGNLALFYLRSGQGAKAQEYYKRACQVDSTLCHELSSRFRDALPDSSPMRVHTQH